MQLCIGGSSPVTASLPIMHTPSSNGAEGNKLLILSAVCLAALVLPLSFSGGAVATPAIGRDLGGTAGTEQVTAAVCALLQKEEAAA